MSSHEPFRAPPSGSSLPYDDGEPMESDRHELQGDVLAALEAKEKR